MNPPVSQTVNQPRRMSLTAEKSLNFYLQESRTLAEGEQNMFLKALRANAQEAFQQRGWPTRRDEDWQYTPLTGFLQNSFSIAGVSQIDEHKIRGLFPDMNMIRLVFIDGHFNDQFSDSLDALPEGLVIETIADVMEFQDMTALSARLNEKAAEEPFALMNTMLFQDGIDIDVAQNVAVELPVFILHVQTKPDHASVLRHHVRLRENAELTFVEYTVSLVEGLQQVTNHVMVIDVASSARLKQYVVQNQDMQSYYFANQWVSQGAQSSFDSLYVGLGSQTARHQNYLNMVGVHANSQQNSVCFVEQTQVQDSRTHTVHVAANCQSQQLHKFVLKDRARGVFNGMIKVARDAQKTDGQMDNKNLILSDEAKMDTKPQLEIYADDVKCSHGSATGQLDEDQVFYLQARGIRKAQAVRLITESFLLEPIENVSNVDISNWIRQLVQNKVGANIV